jgi:hypothetical protein
LDFWPSPDLSHAFEISGESEPKGANSLDIGSGNNSEMRENVAVNTLLGCDAVVPMLQLAGWTCSEPQEVEERFQRGQENKEVFVGSA